MQFKTLKHKTLKDIYGHPMHMPVEIGQCAVPMLQPMTATIEDLKKLYYNQPLFLEQLNDYDLVTVWVSEPLPLCMNTEYLDLGMSPAELIKAWQTLGITIHKPGITDPLEYISQYIPKEILVDNKLYLFKLEYRIPHQNFTVFYQNFELDHKVKYVFENIASTATLLVVLNNLRQILEEADLLPDLYKGFGYTKELFNKDYFPGIKP